MAFELAALRVLGTAAGTKMREKEGSAVRNKQPRRKSERFIGEPLRKRRKSGE